MSMIRNFRNWREYRKTVSELQGLSNRDLADVGIQRSEIPMVARRAI